VLIPEPTTSTATDKRREKQGLSERDAWTDLTPTRKYSALTSILPVHGMDGEATATRIMQP
jgi:hypothetical protein